MTESCYLIATTMELVPGLEISGSVRLVRKLGEGGMGTVWVADHLTLHTQVAVKFMSAHFASSADATARFTREATAAATIKSPHIVQIFDHGLLEGRIPYIVMELLEGENLSSFIHRHGGTLSPGVTAHVIVQMCKALSKAHARNIIHRDIKPDNIFLIDSDGDLFVKLLDFGIAKQVQDNMSVTSTGAVMGTAHYMSPEQMLSSKHVDARSDLWAVGVVAYQCLTGTMPFDGETFAAVAVAVAQGQFELPYATKGIGSPELDAWFSRALSRDVNGRFPSARELAEAFVAASALVATNPPHLGTWGATGQTGTSGPKQPVGAPAAPRTFAGVSATMSGRPSKGKKYAVGAFAAVATLFIGAVVARVVITRGEDGAAAASQVSEPPTPPAAPVAPTEPTKENVPNAQPPSVTAALSAATAPAPTANAAPTASATPSAKASPRKAAARPRSMRTATAAPTEKPKTTPVIPDRGF